MKSALAITFQNELSDKKYAADGRKAIEVPYNLMACLHRLKVDKNIPLIHRHNLKSTIYEDVDELGEEVYQRGVRSILTGNPIDAMKDVKGQDIVLWVKDPAEQYLTSVLSSVYRLPPFDFSTIDGYCYLNIRNAQKIEFFAELKMYVVSLASTLTQMVFLMGSEDKESCINDVVMAALKKSQTLVPKYFDQILIPSFSIEQTNAKYETKGEFEGLKMEYAVQSAEIDLI